MRAAQLLQAGEPAEGGESGIRHVEVRKKVQRELQPLKLLHAGNHFEFGIAFQLAAGPRSECRPREVQLAHVFQAGQMIEFFGIEDGPCEIDARNLQTASWKFREQCDRVA